MYVLGNGVDIIAFIQHFIHHIFVFQPFAIFAAQSRRHPESGLRIGQFVDPGGGIAIGAVAVNDYLYLLTIKGTVLLIG